MLSVLILLHTQFFTNKNYRNSVWHTGEVENSCGTATALCMETVVALAIFHTRCRKAYALAVLWCYPFGALYSFCLAFHNFVYTSHNKHLVRAINHS